MDNIRSRHKPMTDSQFNEYCDYAANNKLTKTERLLLKEWIQAGHSVYEVVNSRYIAGPVYPPMDFIDAYRLDRSISNALRNMDHDDRIDYLREYTGYKDPLPDNPVMAETGISSTKTVENRMRSLERNLYNLWCFVWQEGLGEEAKEFIDEHRDEEIPFEW